MLGLGYVTAILTERIVRNPQTAPYSVCVSGQEEPTCQRETGTKGLAYSGFPFYHNQLILLENEWQVVSTYNPPGFSMRVYNALIFSLVYVLIYLIIKKYARHRN